jgi:Fe-S-cluster containining protein
VSARDDEERLRAAAAAYQRDVVVPHCPSCSAPCCLLDRVVLELDWPQARALYQIGTSRRAFDRALPPELKEAGGTYYAHTKPCPAFDQAKKSCRVYGTPIKPRSCDDFPVYVDGDAVTADRRCEAVDVDALERRLAAELGADVARVVEDDRFPFLVTLRAAARPPPDDRPAPRRRASRAARGDGSRPPRGRRR